MMHMCCMSCLFSCVASHLHVSGIETHDAHGVSSTTGIEACTTATLSMQAAHTSHSTRTRKWSQIMSCNQQNKRCICGGACSYACLSRRCLHAYASDCTRMIAKCGCLRRTYVYELYPCLSNHPTSTQQSQDAFEYTYLSWSILDLFTIDINRTMTARESRQHTQLCMCMCMCMCMMQPLTHDRNDACPAHHMRACGNSPCRHGCES